MGGTRVALLIGCSDYDDPAFQQLTAPARDLDALTRVLRDPEIGDFTVDTLLNESSGRSTKRLRNSLSTGSPMIYYCSISPVTGSWMPEGGCTSLPPTRGEGCWALLGSRRSG